LTLIEFLIALAVLGLLLIALYAMRQKALSRPSYFGNDNARDIMRNIYLGASGRAARRDLGKSARRLRHRSRGPSYVEIATPVTIEKSDAGPCFAYVKPSY
jgi:hypothetical protein